MDVIKLPGSELAEMKQFYQDELDKTVKRLQHIQTMLEKLGAGEKPLEIKVSGGKARQVTAAPEAATAKAGKAAVAPKKRGPKSLWEDLIVKRLKELDKPMTYEELTDEIMRFGKIPESKRKNTKQAIVNVVFRLRKQGKKIDTFSLGSREKYIAMKPWLDAKGEIKEAYRKKIQAEPVKVEEIDAPKKRGRKPAAAKVTEAAAPKKRGRKPAAAKVAEEAAAPKKRGRKPAAAKVAEEAAAPKKRGRKPAAAKVAEESAAPKKRGRKPAAAKVAEESATPKKRGRKPGTTTGKRKPTWRSYTLDVLAEEGRPMLAETVSGRGLSVLGVEPEKADKAHISVAKLMNKMEKESLLRAYRVKGVVPNFYGLPEWFTNKGDLKPAIKDKMVAALTNEE